MKSRSLIILAAIAAAHAQAANGFSVAKDAKGIWNFYGPDSKPFFAKACAVVIPKDGALKPGARGYDALAPLKGDKAAWAKSATTRLKRYGFNTIGAWSDDSLYDQGLVVTHSLALAGYDANRLVGVWSPEFKAKVEAKVLIETEKLKSNPRLLGYYLDNELPWYGDTGWPGPQNTPLINKYLALAAGPDRSQAEKALKAYFKGEALPKGEFPLKLQAAFAAQVAEQYFSVCEAALKKADPHHLNLGARFAGNVYDGVVAACGRHCDVVSLNMYSKSGNFDVKTADRMHVLSGFKPIMITEFSYRAMQNRSGDKNSAGADVTVETQADRASHLKSFLAGGMDLPYLVGYHWFQYFDESPQGRSFDGEDSNYGLVDIKDAEYEELRAAFIQINASAESTHAKASHVVPQDAAETREPQLRQIGQMTAPGGPTRIFRSFETCTKDGLNVWNESSASGQFECQGKTLEFSFDSGKSWGLGLGFAPTSGDNKDGSCNLLRYEHLVFTATLDQGKSFTIYMSESGVAEPGKPSYDSVGGSDGECWETPELSGTGKREAYTVNLADMQLRPTWGNQDGNRIIDIQAIKSFDIYLKGKQGKGKVAIESFELK